MAASTTKTYRAGIRQFYDHDHVCALPAMKRTVACFAVAMTWELTPSTIRVNLSVVTFILMHKYLASQIQLIIFLLKVALKGAKWMHTLQPTRESQSQCNFYPNYSPRSCIEGQLNRKIDICWLPHLLTQSLDYYKQVSSLFPHGKSSTCIQQEAAFTFELITTPFTSTDPNWSVIMVVDMTYTFIA